MRKKAFTILFLLGVFTFTTLAQNSSIVLKGQVVCSACWFEADRKVKPYGSEADLQCAAACSKKGIPTALAVTDKDKTTLYLLEYGKLQKTEKGWLEHVGKRVELKGTVREQDGKRYLKVDALTPAS
jgi:hypothetical protein